MVDHADPQSCNEVIIKITMLSKELLSVSHGWLDLQAPISQHQQKRSKMANESVYRFGIALSIVGLYSDFVVLLDLESQVWVKDKL